MPKKIKQYLKSGAFVVVSCLPFSVLQRLTKRDVVIINYHSIKGIDPDPIINKNVYRTEVEFENDIIFLKEHFQFITLEELLNPTTRKARVIKPKVFLTFDDGLAVVYHKIMPILVKHQVSAAVFINPDFIDNNDLHYQRKKNLLLQRVSQQQVANKNYLWKELLNVNGLDSSDFANSINVLSYRNSKLINSLLDVFDIDISEYLKTNPIYLSSDQIEKMKQVGFYFGGHSMDHPNYSELTIAEQIVQTQSSVEWVKEKFSLDYSVFAFPLKDHDITLDFFELIKDHCQLTFGVMGIMDDEVQNHLQRIDVESTSVHIKSVLKLEYLKYLSKKTFGYDTYKRNR